MGESGVGAAVDHMNAAIDGYIRLKVLAQMLLDELEAPYVREHVFCLDFLESEALEMGLDVPCTACDDDGDGEAPEPFTLVGTTIVYDVEPVSAQRA